ncbi:MAG: hypothetical protein AAFS10_04895, partial [Myxococcota bacterium]
MSEGTIKVENHQDSLCRVRDDLSTQLEKQKSTVDESSNSTGKPTKSSPTKPTEDPSEKVERFEDGVDEVADQIEDLSAFDDLCEAIDDDEDPKPALNRIRSTSVYKKLSKMWAGALEGGSEAGRMQRAFNNMFDGRGFWASTEQAFSMVASAAKRDAVLDARAKAAKQTAKEAQNKNPESEGTPKEKPKGGGEDGPSANPSIEQVMKDAAEAQYKEMDVKSPKPPPIAAYEEAEAAHGLANNAGSPFALATQEFEFYNKHNEQLTTMVDQGGLGTRADLIFKEMGNGLLGGLVKGGLDQAKDSLVSDVLGGLADKGLQMATKGKIKAPIIGPALTLFQSGLIGDIASGNLMGGKFATGLKQSGAKIGKSAGNMVKNFGKANVASVDGVGFLCAGIADLLTMLCEIVDMAAQILGVLSAICFVLGGILILAGMALVWLAGVGAPLIAAGGWLVNAGNVLSKIVAVLGPISMALSLAASVFRVAAAFMVPADAFSEQLQGVNDNVGKFGEKAGAKMVDTTVNTSKQAAAEKFTPKKKTANAAVDQAGNDGTNQGSGLANKTNNSANETVAKLDDAKNTIKKMEETPVDGGKKPTGGDDGVNAKKPKEGDDGVDAKKPKEGDDGVDAKKPKEGDDGVDAKKPKGDGPEAKSRGQK